MPTENEPKIDQKIEQISSAQQHSEQINGTYTLLQQNHIEISRDKPHANEKAIVWEKTNDGRDRVAGKPHTKQESEKEKFIS
jgi:hypothetical protein